MFLDFGIKDAIDVLLVAVLLYQTYKLMKSTGATSIFTGIMVFVVIWFLIVKVLKLGLMGAILNQVISIGAIALVVLFQNEIRRFLVKLGSRQNWKFYNKISAALRGGHDKDDQPSFPVIKLVMACRDMARTKTGALIVIGRENPLDEYIESGDQFHADINTRLIENIFFKNSPLHDGALIIIGDRIVAAGAVLPVSKKSDIPRYLGLRHRAAMGVSENSDAVVIIVSEERGSISMAVDGAYKLNLTPEELERELTELIK